jgi:hypothetical protein
MYDLPQMDQDPEYADLMALLRAQIREDEPQIQALLVETRIDPYAVLALVLGHTVRLGERAYGTVDAYDEWLAGEQRAIGR